MYERVTSDYKSIYYRVISNPDVFCRDEKCVNAQCGAITDFSPKKQASKNMKHVLTERTITVISSPAVFAGREIFGQDACSESKISQSLALLRNDKRMGVELPSKNMNMFLLKERRL